MSCQYPILVFVLSFLAISPIHAGDWPMWRYDAGCSAVSPHALPEGLKLHWVRQLPESQPAWPASQPKLQFDRFYQPVVMGHRLFVGSNVNDSVAAYDTRSGNELWRFFTEAPVRFAPVTANGKVYAISDDGFLYCLNAESGALLWKVNGGPTRRPIIGNDRLVSTWPARGGVVLADGVLYFAASIWPSMGIFIHAVDAETGRILWTNSETGSRYMVHPHGAASFGSIVPQGYLAVSGNYLVVPGGRSLPAVFNRKTGELIHFNFGGKSSGGFQVMAAGDCYCVGGDVYRLKDGNPLTRLDARLMTDEFAIALERDFLQIQSLAGEIKTETTTDRKGKKQSKVSFAPHQKRFVPRGSELPDEIYCRAGNRLFLGEKNKVASMEFDPQSKKPLQVNWSAKVEGTPTTMIAADDRLFVVTAEAKLYCFAALDQEAIRHDLNRTPLSKSSDKGTTIAKSAIKASKTKAGYAVALGIGSGRIIEEIIGQTNFHLVAVETDQKKRNRLQNQMSDAGLYGTRLAVFSGNPTAFPYPPYFANLIVTEDAALSHQLIQVEPLRHVFQALRPYGGVLVLPTTDAQHQSIQQTLNQHAEIFDGAQLDREGDLTFLRRVGPLPKSAEWSHQYGDATNSVVSKDQLVKAPLGVLWFGGPSNDKVLPRHGHGPSPQVAGGRLVIEGPDMLRAVDVYTGRVHWEKDLPGVGDYYNVTSHFSGAGEVGSNYVTLGDQVFVIHNDKILELNAETGETRYTYELPKIPGNPQPHWGYLAAAGPRLVATSSPVKLPGTSTRTSSKPVVPKDYHTIIKPHSSWQFLAGSDPQDNWTQSADSTKTWKQGTAGFGYGDGDDRTVLKTMPGRFARVYVRKEIPGSEMQNLKELALAINYDDAFIAYLNGHEIARINVGKGNGKNASRIGSHEAKGYELVPIKNFQKLIREGKNVLAIEGHNTSTTSSDFTLDPYLVGKPAGNSPLAKAEKETKDSSATKKLSAMLESASKSSSSRRLVVFDRKTHRELWNREAVYSFRHNGIVVTENHIFCIDSLSPDQLQTLKRRGVQATGEPRLLALDAQTGDVIWSTTKNVFGTFLNYSTEHDVLLQAGSAYRDRAKDEVGTGMIAYRGSTGDVLWQDLKLSYNGPCLLWKDKIITNGAKGFQLGLLDGEKTGWSFSRMYGCNTVLGSEHLLTFRSGAAGFCDLTGDSGTGNLGGFRSSCTSNLIAADGVLNAPDYTRTCSCAYQNQTSVAWIHMPDADAWTFSSLGSTDDLERIGWNLGAPGDRRSTEGTLWLEYPNEGGPSPRLDVKLEPKQIDWFEDHASTIEGESLPWVAASGGEGVRKLTLAVPDGLAKHQSWNVRLYFREPRSLEPGQRVFSIEIQGDRVADNCDVMRESGGANISLTKSFKDILSGKSLTVELTPTNGSKPPIISGVEILPQTENAKSE